jgi:GT2 family glycosyltransferase
VGGLDDSFFLYVEEVDWCYRMRKAGWRLVFTPNAEVVHLSSGPLTANPTLCVHLRF